MERITICSVEEEEFLFLFKRSHPPLNPLADAPEFHFHSFESRLTALHAPLSLGGRTTNSFRAEDTIRDGARAIIKYQRRKEHGPC